MNTDFGRLENKYSLGTGSVAEYYTKVDEKKYFAALAALSSDGYEKKEEKNIAENCFTVFTNGDEDIYASYYTGLKEAVLVREPHGKYLEFRDTPRGVRVKPLMTQLDLCDFGESVVFRLPDARFIIFDGGREFMPDADKLFACLKEQSGEDKPTVAAWILTHPHIDHYRGAVCALEKYGDSINVQAFIYSFPDGTEEDFVRIPRLEKEKLGLSMLESVVKKSGADVIKAHTGQVFDIGGARLELLFTPDDMRDETVEDINAMSLVVKMTVAGQSIMMCADCMLPYARLAEKFGKYLKCDILQPAHHMFIGGDIPTYRLIDPETVVVPSFEDDVFGRISPYQDLCKKENLCLFYDLGVSDFFTGSTGNVVLELPYKPRENGRELYFEKLREYKRRAGALSWYFSDVTREDATFTFLNTTAEVANVYADLYFDEVNDIVLNILIKVPPMRTVCVDLFDPEAANADALFYNHNSLLKKGTPDGKPFTVNFKSDVPITVSGKKPALYHS